MNLSMSDLRELLCSKSEAANTDEALRIAVLDRGWVFVGLCRYEGDALKIDNAKCVRLWGTTRGLGEIAMNGPTKDTKLDDSGSIEVPRTAVMFLMRCEASKWKL